MRKLLLSAVMAIGMLYTAQAQQKTTVNVSQSSTVVQRAQAANVAYEPGIEVIVNDLDFDQYKYVYISHISGAWSRRMKKSLRKHLDGSFVKVSKEKIMNNQTLYANLSLNYANNSNWTFTLIMKNRKNEIVYKVIGVNQTLGSLLEPFIL